MPQLCRLDSAYASMCTHAGTDIGKFLKGHHPSFRHHAVFRSRRTCAHQYFVTRERSSGFLGTTDKPWTEGNDFPLINNIVQKVRSRAPRMNVTTAAADDIETSDLPIRSFWPPGAQLRALKSFCVCAFDKRYLLMCHCVTVPCLEFVMHVASCYLHLAFTRPSAHVSRATHRIGRLRSLRSGCNYTACREGGD